MKLFYVWVSLAFLGSTIVTGRPANSNDYLTTSSSDSDSSESESELDGLSDLEDASDAEFDDIYNVEDLTSNVDGNLAKFGHFDGKDTKNEDTSASLDLNKWNNSSRKKSGNKVKFSSNKSKSTTKKKRKKTYSTNENGNKLKFEDKKHVEHKKLSSKKKLKQQQLNEQHGIKPINASNDTDMKHGLKSGKSSSKHGIKAHTFDSQTHIITNQIGTDQIQLRDSEIENKVYKKLVAELNKTPDLDIAGISESIRYLGSGYDIIFGNPIGDPLMMVDPGYRNPIIQLEWDKHSTFAHNNSLPQPVDGWVRPEISCKQAEKVDHVNTLEDYKKELSVDAVASSDFLNFFAFSASGGYKNFAKLVTQEKTRSFILKTYCLRYIAGLEVSTNLKLTPAFKNAVDKLPVIFDGFEEYSSCPIEKYKANESDTDCESNVRPWMDFFKEFGTHFTSVVHLGGKMTYQVQMKQSDINKLQEQGVNVDAAIKATCGFGMPNISGKISTKGESTSISKMSDYKVEKMIMVIGGEPPKDLNDSSNLNNWAKSVAKSPMPIKSELIPIRELFDLHELQQSYNQAIKYYSEVYGISQNDMYEIKGKIKGIPEIIKEAQQVTYDGPAPGRVVCPIGTTILFGFSMTITKKKKALDFLKNTSYNVNIVPCVVGNEKCSGTAQSDSIVKIWALCSPHPAPLLVQVSSHKNNGPATVECPKGFVIGMGFGITFPKGLPIMPQDIYPCRNGQTSCTKIPDKDGSTTVWAVCFESGAIEVDNLTNNAKAGSSASCEAHDHITSGLVNTCPDDYEVLCGFSMALTRKNSHTDDHFKACRGGKSCAIDKHKRHDNECIAYASWNVCSLVVPGHKDTVHPARANVTLDRTKTANGIEPIGKN
ncbi:sporozoite microneme protein 2 [Babesia microti strain RI]|uniref:Sporozoite microneme protein 2 n=1 Tax=Babesia microti (strain RI) TaxID=1133968 RepID=A0A1R4A9W0_BABMR|nr:sporozoite microneme protein 2 [Babesia microti strain RI]SJK85791.1 sporozoite microneme protein 2 [Babesia microti strain RI]|eukprot:XP_021338013.1 sporozoite microneme protein 2 [Babesia microti strain RI]